MPVSPVNASPFSTQGISMLRSGVCLAIIGFILSLTCTAQQYPYPGFPMFSTQLGSQYDQIDIADGNISLGLPLRSITSGPVPLNYVLFGASNAYIYNSQEGDPAEVWEITTPSFALMPNLSAHITYLPDPEFETCNGNLDTLYSNFGIVDSSGVVHPLTISPFDSQGCYTFQPGTYPATDGSGYTVILSGTYSSWSTTIYDIGGNKYVPSSGVIGTVPALAGFSTPDGVTAQAVANGSCVSGASGTCTNITDALTSSPVLSQQVTTGGYGASYSYVNSSNNAITTPFTVAYSSYNWATNFGCSGVGEIGPGSTHLVSSITTPTGGAYSFTYEPTPGKSGYYTGRIASIKLPSGGSISYSYSGGNNGINCTSGVVPTLTRTVNDNNGNVNKWTYVNSNGLSSPKANYTVIVTDPASNQTLYMMAGQFQTEVFSFQGGCTFSGCNGGGTLLKTVLTCYNAVFTNCATPSQIDGPPGSNFSQTDVYTSYNGGPYNLVETKYNTLGAPTEIKRYDFGVNTGSAPTGTPLSDTLIYYGQSWNGSACSAYPSGVYINNTPCYSYTKNSAGTPVAKTQITYSNSGHPNSVEKWTAGSSWLTSSATYNSDGTIATSTDANGTLSTFAYNGTGGCDSLLATSVTVTGNDLPSSGLTTSQTWNCNAGVLASSKDANGQATQYGYANESGVADPLWRRLSVTDPLTNVTWTDYSAGGMLPETVETYMNFPVSNPTSTIDTLNTLDGLERVIQSKKRTAPGATTFDSTVNYAYPWNSTGAYMTQTVPGGTGVTTTQLDAIGRASSMADGGGGSTSNVYSNNNTLVTLGPAPSGENTKKRQLQYDGLGRLTSTCEITAGTTTWPGGNCAQSTSQTGYWSTYTYDPLNDLMSITQNAQSSTSQSRSYAYDGLQRMTSETNPESGTKTYLYDTESSCGPNGSFSSAGDLLQTTDADGNQICYYYDGLHRLYNVGNNAQSNTNFCKRFRYDSTANGYTSAPSGYPSQPYVAGRLMEAETDNCTGTLLTDEWFSYNADGQMTGIWELTPHSGQYYYSSANVAADGAATSLQLASPSLYTMTWTLDGEGRLYTLTDTTSNELLVSGAEYWPSTTSPRVVLTGSDTDSYSIDPNTGRMAGYTFTVNGESMTAGVNWNSNWTLNNLVISDGFNSGGTQTCNYNPTNVSGTGYDDLSRLIGVDCGSGQWGQTYSYDPFSNLTKQQISGRQGTTWAPGYNETNNHCLGCTYDSDGNLTGDGNDVYGWNVYSKVAWTATSGTPTCGSSGRCAVYDALGRMVEQSTGSTWHERWITPVGLTALMTGTTSMYAFWPGPGGGTAIVYGNSTGYDYLHKDWLGNTRIVSNPQNHHVDADQAYSPFGEIYDIYGSNVAYYQFFSGMGSVFAPSTTTPTMWDADNRELSYAGRWLSPDPAGLAAADPMNPQSWNRYAYVANNPLGNIDPTGLDDEDGVGQPYPGCDPDANCTLGGEPIMDNGIPGFLAPPQNTTLAPLVYNAGNEIWPSPFSGPYFPNEPFDWAQQDAQVIVNLTNSRMFWDTASNFPTLAANNESYAWTFTKAFFTNFSLSAVYHSFGEGGCDRLMAETLADAFNPLPGDGVDPGDVAELGPKAVASAGQAAASAYSVYQGLSVPLRSSIYRGLQSSTYGYAGALEEAAPYAVVVYAGGNALYTAGSAAYNGECH